MFRLSLIVTALLFSALTYSADLSSQSNFKSCVELVNQVQDRYHPLKSGPITAGENSYASLFPDYQKFRSNLMASRPSIDNFAKSYFRKRGAHPTVSEVLDFYLDQIEKFVHFIDSSTIGHQEVDYYLRTAASQTRLSNRDHTRIKGLIDENNELLRRLYDPEDNDIRSFFERVNTSNYKGHLGELDTLLRLDHVITGSMKITKKSSHHKETNELIQIFLEAIENLQKIKSPKLIDRLEKRYPHIFKLGGETAEEKMANLVKYLQTKEFDVVLKRDDKFVLVEVKNLKYPLTLKKLDPRNGEVKVSKNKTLIDQQRENIEIINILGLQDRVYLGMALFRGITPEARSYLEEMGISVLGRVIE